MVLMKAQFCCYQDTLLSLAHHVSARHPVSSPSQLLPSWPAPAHMGASWVIPPQMQSSAFALVKLHEVSISPSLQLVRGPLSGGHAPQHTCHSPQHGGAHKPAEDACHLLAKLLMKMMNEMSSHGHL